MKLFISVIGIVFLCSCGSQTTTQANEPNLAAKAGNENLSSEELSTNLSSMFSSKDSLNNSQRIIEQWGRESLFYQEAISTLEKEEIEIEKQVENYKRELVNYIYQSKIIEANLDTMVSNAEIEDYYNQHKDNFILKENIIKVNYIKISVKVPALEKIRSLIFSLNPLDKEKLKTLCIQNAETFFMNDSTWLYLDDVKKEIPALKDQPDYSLYAGRIIQYTDAIYYYFLKIKEVKIKNSLSPVNFERQNIKKFIINNRKTQLIAQYKQLLLEKAKGEKKFVVY